MKTYQSRSCWYFRSEKYAQWKTPLPPAAPIKACITTEEEADIRQTKPKAKKKTLPHLAEHITRKNIRKIASGLLIVLHNLRDTITKGDLIKHFGEDNLTIHFYSISSFFFFQDSENKFDPLFKMLHIFLHTYKIISICNCCPSVYVRPFHQHEDLHMIRTFTG